jgi:indole-3-glycerol phosphate synthase
MNILDKIIEHKKTEVRDRKSRVNEETLRKAPFFSRETLSLKKFLLDENKTGIIAEFKRKSPSKGMIHEKADVAAITAAYSNYGASALSVLTDELFFGGSTEDLMKARINPVPILRKDFIIDEYQILEARAMGADTILLIAACLDPQAVKQLAAFAKTLQLEVLLEIHREEELQHICDETELVGVNNRDLKTFSVDLNRSAELSRKIPADKITVAESGISNVDTIHYLKTFGFKGFLIGENFMKAPDPAIAFASFVNQLKNGSHESKGMRHDATRSGQEIG